MQDPDEAASRDRERDVYGRLADGETLSLADVIADLGEDALDALRARALRNAWLLVEQDGTLRLDVPR